MGLAQQELESYALTRLGSPITEVELTKLSFSHAIDQVLKRYSRVIPRERAFVMSSKGSLQKYLISDEIYGQGILDVQIPTFDPIAPLLLSSGPRLDIFGYRYSYPYRDISELNLDLIYFEMATRILSSDIDWEPYDEEDADGTIKHYLYITPKPNDAFQFTIFTAHDWTLKNFPSKDEDWLKDYFTALVKHDLGIIRSKFSDSVAGAQQSFQLNGAMLINESKEEKRELEVDLRSRTPIFPVRRK